MRGRAVAITLTGGYGRFEPQRDVVVRADSAEDARDRILAARRQRADLELIERALVESIGFDPTTHAAVRPSPTPSAPLVSVAPPKERMH